MGKRGPQKTPTKILEMNGSWRAGRRQDEPQPQYGRPECPGWFSDEEKEIWNRVAGQLEKMDLLATCDASALERYVRTYIKWRDCETFLKKHGFVHVAKTKDGKMMDMKSFPHVGISLKLGAELLRLEREFGLTPSARANMAIERPSDEQELRGKGRFFGAG